MGRRHPISLRLSPSFEDFLRELGGNQSALLRALALIGADAAGYDLTVAQRDLHEALKDTLPAAVAAALLDIVMQRQAQAHGAHLRPALIPPKDFTPVALPDIEGATAVAAPATDAEHDPFASVGFSFD